MTPSDSAPPPRFTRAPRSQGSTKAFAQQNFLDGVDAIEAFLVEATHKGREGFHQNSSAYACGSLALIRAAGLFDVDDFTEYLSDTPPEIANALRTIRDLTSHPGHRAMNDESLWVTLTVELPPYVARWRRTAEQEATD